MRIQRMLLWLGLIGWMATAGLLAAPARPPVSLPPEPGVNSSAEHRLLPGDELEITVEALPDQSRVVKVREDGNFYMPLFGEVRAEGRSIRDLEKSLRSRLAEKLKDPEVQIGLKDTAPRNIVVLGEVNKPGQYPISPETTAVEALAKAGGSTPGANLAEATLIRGQSSLVVSLLPPPPGARVEGVRVQPGDVLYVRQAERVNVAGEVTQPGVVVMSTGRKTVWNAIMAAGGPKAEGALSRVQLARIGQDSAKVLDLSLGPKAPDASLTLENGDTVTVPMQRVLVLGGSSGGFVPLTGHDNLLEVMGRSGQIDVKSITKVDIIREKDLRENHQQIEEVDVSSSLQKGDQRVMVAVHDGDVVVIHTKSPKSSSFTDSLTIFSIARSLFRF